jgi:hypothetical protein
MKKFIRYSLLVFVVLLVVGCEEPGRASTSIEKISLLKASMSEAQVTSVIGPCKFNILGDPTNVSEYSYKVCTYVTGPDEWYIMISWDDKLESACNKDHSQCVVRMKELVIR